MKLIPWAGIAGCCVEVATVAAGYRPGPVAFIAWIAIAGTWMGVSLLQRSTIRSQQEHIDMLRERRSP